MSDFKTLNEAVIKGDVQTALTETQKALDAGQEVRGIIDNGLIAAMDEVGERFSKGQLFVPQMLRSAKTMQECMNLLKPHLKEGEITTKGVVVIGTVKGDLHDIGKNLVSMMLEGADVAPEEFAKKAQEVNADLLGISALLSITMPAMADTVKALKNSGIRDKVKVMIGGAPVTDKYAQEIQADAYAPDAASAVIGAKKLLDIS